MTDFFFETCVGGSEAKRHINSWSRCGNRSIELVNEAGDCKVYGKPLELLLLQPFQGEKLEKMVVVILIVQ